MMSEAGIVDVVNLKLAGIKRPTFWKKRAERKEDAGSGRLNICKMMRSSGFEMGISG